MVHPFSMMYEQRRSMIAPPTPTCMLPTWLWSVKLDPANFDLVLSLPGYCFQRPTVHIICHYLPNLVLMNTKHAIIMIVCGCCYLSRFMFSNFYQLDLHRNREVMLHWRIYKGNISENRIENWTSNDLVILIGSVC